MSDDIDPARGKSASREPVRDASPGTSGPVGASPPRPAAEVTPRPAPTVANSPGPERAAGSPPETAPTEAPTGASVRPASATVVKSDLPPPPRATPPVAPQPPKSEPPRPRQPAEPDTGGPRLWPRILAILILLSGVALTWAWLTPNAWDRLTSAIGSRKSDTATLETRIAALEKRPLPADISAMSARLDALERRTATPDRVLTTGTPPIGVTAGNIQDMSAIQERLNALEKASGSGKVDALASRVDALANRDGAAPLRAQMDDLQQRVAGLASQEQSAAATSDRTVRLARLQSASAALAAGIKLGPIPGAPPALTRFAATPPPTEAALRLAFPTVMREAAKLTTPDTEGKPFLDRVLARLADYRLITVREGDRVVIGNATLETLEQARASLNAGDLAGAVRLAGGISGPPATVIAPWLADAKALLAARAALAEALAALAGNG